MDVLLEIHRKVKSMGKFIITFMQILKATHSLFHTFVMSFLEALHVLQFQIFFIKIKWKNSIFHQVFGVPTYMIILTNFSKLSI